jgi:hypothetical protein
MAPLTVADVWGVALLHPKAPFPSMAPENVTVVLNV